MQLHEHFEPVSPAAFQCSSSPIASSCCFRCSVPQITISQSGFPNNTLRTQCPTSPVLVTAQGASTTSYASFRNSILHPLVCDMETIRQSPNLLCPLCPLCSLGGCWPTPTREVLPRGDRCCKRAPVSLRAEDRDSLLAVSQTSMMVRISRTGWMAHTSVSTLFHVFHILFLRVSICMCLTDAHSLPLPKYFLCCVFCSLCIRSTRADRLLLICVRTNVCSEQIALEGQDLPRTYLAHHELRSVSVTMSTSMLFMGCSLHGLKLICCLQSLSSVATPSILLESSFGLYTVLEFWQCQHFEQSQSYCYSSVLLLTVILSDSCQALSHCCLFCADVFTPYV